MISFDEIRTVLALGNSDNGVDASTQPAAFIYFLPDLHGQRRSVPFYSSLPPLDGNGHSPIVPVTTG